MADSTVFYTSNLEIYVEKQPNGSPFAFSNKPVDVVRRLCAPIRNTGRNITMNNWFSDILLAEELVDAKLSMVGTLKKKIIPILSAFKNVCLFSVSGPSMSLYCLLPASSYSYSHVVGSQLIYLLSYRRWVIGGRPLGVPLFVFRHFAILYAHLPTPVRRRFRDFRVAKGKDHASEIFSFGSVKRRGSFCFQRSSLLVSGVETVG